MRYTKVDKLGRVVIPMDIRRALNIDSGSRLTVNLHNGTVFLIPENSTCRICSKPATNKYFALCADCIAKIKEQA